MRLDANRLHRFKVSLPAIARNAQSSWQTRRGVLLELVDSEGRSGWGEASPLPGYSVESYQCCLESLAALRWPHVLPDTLVEACVWLANDPALAGVPSARYAAEIALLDLFAQRRRQPAWKILRDIWGFPGCWGPLGLAAIVDTADAVQAAAEARRAVSAGFRALKLKVGGLGLDRDLERIDMVLDALGPDTPLRLDVNRGWSLLDARNALLRLSHRRLEFVEEPVRDGLWCELGAVSVPLAADESLQHPARRSMLAALAECGVKYVVIKPMVLGLQGSIDWATEACRLGLQVVVSHLLDGPVAMAGAAALALAMGSSFPAPGLGRHPALDAWPQCGPAAYRDTYLVPTDTPGLGLIGSPARSQTRR